jgi:hypothetical protein
MAANKCFYSLRKPDKARVATWLRNNPRPMGDPPDTGFLTLSQAFAGPRINLAVKEPPARHHPPSFA